MSLLPLVAEHRLARLPAAEHDGGGDESAGGCCAALFGGGGSGGGGGGRSRAWATLRALGGSLLAPASELPTLDALSFVQDALPPSMLPAAGATGTSSSNQDAAVERRAVARRVARAVTATLVRAEEVAARRRDAAWRRCQAQLRLLDALSDACGVLLALEEEQVGRGGGGGGGSTSAGGGGRSGGGVAPDTLEELEWLSARATPAQLAATLAAARASLAEICRCRRKEEPGRRRRGDGGDDGDDGGDSQSSDGRVDESPPPGEEAFAFFAADDADIPSELRRVSASYARQHAGGRARGEKGVAGGAGVRVSASSRPATPPLRPPASRQASPGADGDDDDEAGSGLPPADGLALGLLPAASLPTTPPPPPPPPPLRRSELPRSVAVLLRSRDARRKATALATELASIDARALAWATAPEQRDGARLGRLAAAWRRAAQAGMTHGARAGDGGDEEAPPSAVPLPTGPPASAAATLLECVATAAAIPGIRPADAAPMAFEAAASSLRGRRRRAGGGGGALGPAGEDRAEADARQMRALGAASAAQVAELRAAAAAAEAAEARPSSLSPPSSPPPASSLPAATIPDGAEGALAAPPPCARPGGLRSRLVGGSKGGGGKSCALRAAAAAAAAADGARAERSGDDLELARD